MHISFLNKTILFLSHAKNAKDVRVSTIMASNVKYTGGVALQVLCNQIFAMLGS